MTKKNIAIIGGGPAGLSAAVYAARAGLEPIVFAGSPPGGQLMLTTEVENFPGYLEIMGPSLIENLRKQAAHFGTDIVDENVLAVEFNEQKRMLNTSKAQYEAKAVIVAMGAQALWLGIESEQRLRGRGVSACATCDGFFFRNKNVAVVGGGDTALEEAQTLTRFANKVYIVHRRGQFRASKIMQDRVKNDSKIELVMNTEIEEILGEQKVEGIRLSTEIKGKNTLAVDGVFVAIGHKPDTQILKGKVELDEKGYVLTSAMVAWNNFSLGGSNLSMNKFSTRYQTLTSATGVFAAGDCVDHIYRQASTAAGMGVAASLDAERWLEKL